MDRCRGDVRDAVLVRDDRELTRVRQVRQEHLRN